MLFPRFDHPVDSVVWPANLRQLTFDGGFNQPIEAVAWPHGLKQLTLGRNFDQPIGQVSFVTMFFFM